MMRRLPWSGKGERKHGGSRRGIERRMKARQLWAWVRGSSLWRSCGGCCCIFVGGTPVGKARAMGFDLEAAEVVQVVDAKNTKENDVHRSQELTVRSHGLVVRSQELAALEPEASQKLPPPRVLMHSAPELREVNLLLSVETQGGSYQNGRFRSETVHALHHETIHNLRLRLRDRGLFTNSHCLVFGDRELLGHETVGQVAARVNADGGEPDYLHVFARLADVGAMRAAAGSRRELAMSSGGSGDWGAVVRSALTDRLSRSNRHNDGRELERMLMVRGRVVGIGEALNELVDTNAPVVHMVIRRSSRIRWARAEEDGWFEISISALDTVDIVKKKLEEAEGIATDRYRFLCSGELLAPGKPLASYGIGKGSVLELIPVEKTGKDGYPDGSPRLSSPKHQLFEHWQQAKDALAQGVAPRLAPAGTGGSYFIYSNNETKVAVFKPEDEEPQARNNPKGHTGSPDGQGLRRGVRPGEGATREVLAYLLDHEHFSGVPPTAMVTLKGMDDGAEKIGSFQQFIPHDCDCENMGSSAFPVHEVHKIGVLDVRLANADRNEGNILARQNPSDGKWELTPIDHGYCLPSSFEDVNFEWLNWNQSKAPFSETTLEYIEKLDAENDLRILSMHGLSLRSECERVLRVCTMLLKKAAKRGWTLYRIGNAMCRQASQMSPLEEMHQRAKELALQEEYGEEPNGTRAVLICNTELYLRHMESILDQFLSEMPIEDEDVFL